jgi:butyrate kinase
MQGSGLILAINPGSTSTKIGLYAEDLLRWSCNVRHSEEKMQQFAGRPMLDQFAFRAQEISAELTRRAVAVGCLSAVVGRGGLLRPLASGTYLVNKLMLDELRTAERGDHASNIGASLAASIASQANCPAFIVDPVSVDEWPPVARLGGHAQLERQCLSHALNTKAVAKRYAREQRKPYSELRLIVAHLGSGISVSAHEGGRMIDVTNSREEGAFSTERAGSVPCMKLVEWCFSGTVTKKEVEAALFREGGLYSYLKTKDLVEVERNIAAGDEKARLIWDAMVYQIAKEIGAYATVLKGKVDAILLTGGMAHSESLVAALRERIAWIATVNVYPGEDELQALAEGALRVLRGEEEAKVFAAEPVLV